MELCFVYSLVTEIRKDGVLLFSDNSSSSLTSEREADELFLFAWAYANAQN